MKILIIDREDIIAQRITSHLEPLGHEVIYEPIKSIATEKVNSGDFDIVFMDPAPLTSAQPGILNMRRNTGKYLYVVQMGPSITKDQAIKCSANNSLRKPIDPNELDNVMETARKFMKQINRIGDNTKDFPSAGGIISRSAFNQLFLSSIIQANRYGERSFIVLIGIKNYNIITEDEGSYTGECESAKLAQYLVRLRRQSDIIAQIESHEYALLLQRPIYETEPKEAANRFAESIKNNKALFEKDGIEPEFYVELIDIPVGLTLISHTLTADKNPPLTPLKHNGVT